MTTPCPSCILKDAQLAELQADWLRLKKERDRLREIIQDYKREANRELVK